MSEILNQKFSLQVNKVLILLLMIPLIHIEGLSFLAPGIYFFLFRICTVVSFIVVGILFLLSIYKKRKISKFIVITILLASLNIMLTIINHGDVINALGIWTYILPVLFLFDVFREDIYTVINTLYWYLLIIVFINFLLTFAYPEGLYPNSTNLGLGKLWLLGYKSSLQNFILPLVMFSYLKALYSHKYGAFSIVMLLGHVECYFSGNSMFLVGLLICDVIAIFNVIGLLRISKLLLLTSVTGILIFNFILVVYTQDFLNMSYVKWLIMDLLGKDITLSMRTNAWIATIDEVVRNPIWGQGYTSLEYREFIFNRPTAHSHNMFLEILYEGGLVALMLFFYLIYLVWCKFYRFRNLRTTKCIFLYMLVIFIMYSFENIMQKSCGLIWLVFFIGNYVDLLDYSFRNLNNKFQKGFAQ